MASASASGTGNTNYPIIQFQYDTTVPIAAPPPPPLPPTPTKKRVWREELDKKTLEVMEKEMRNHDEYFNLLKLQQEHYKLANEYLRMKIAAKKAEFWIK